MKMSMGDVLTNRVGSKRPRGVYQVCSRKGDKMSEIATTEGRKWCRGEAGEQTRVGWRESGLNIAQPAFNASSIGQPASVTCVDVDRLPINPVIHISSTSLKRRPGLLPSEYSP